MGSCNLVVSPSERENLKGERGACMNGAPYRCAGRSGCAAPGEGWAGFRLFKVLVLTALLGWQTPSGLLVQLDHPGPGCEGTWPCPDPWLFRDIKLHQHHHWPQYLSLNGQASSIC